LKILQTLFLFGFLLSISAQAFELATPEKSATIFISENEPECVHMAVQDLVSDVLKIARKEIQVVSDLSACSENTVIVGTATSNHSLGLLQRFLPDAASLDGKWEAFHVQNVSSNIEPVKEALVIAGSDQRGTMYGVYAFCEHYLGVDPFYIWTGREPGMRDHLQWNEIELMQDEPTFKFRGWFLNDEDLLVGWMEDGGKRHIRYPHYHQVTSPTIYDWVYETMLRLRLNLVIPASFNDIINPDEARAIEMADRRGLFSSMHHIEPVGVSGFAFSNYWRYRGGSEFSIVKFPERFKEIWTFYAKLWSRYDNVVWQLGLRGIADRPVWASDPQVPKSDEARGKLISNAIQQQMEIIDQVETRDPVYATTTLWMEGARLHEQGFLEFPENVAVIFADNSPGWTMQEDFYNVERQPGRDYGYYYHHALWGVGPHLVQGVSPQKAYSIAAEAVERQTNYYAILNVSNIRQFVLGLQAAARFMNDFDEFDPDEYLDAWCQRHFGHMADQAVASYRAFFDSYVTREHSFHSEMGGVKDLPVLLDGQTLHRGERIFSKLWTHVLLDDPAHELDTDEELGESLSEVQEQIAGLEKAGTLGKVVRQNLTGDAKMFYEENFIAQWHILMGLEQWLEAGILATQAFKDNDRPELETQVNNAMEAFEMIRKGQALTSHGKWQGWYRGDRKMNLDRAGHITAELDRALEQ
jgi:hypothetical protein